MADTNGISNGNGYNRIVWWIIGTLSALVLGGGGGWVKSIDNRVGNVEASNLVRGERLTVVETIVPEVRDQLREVNQRLSRLEQQRPSHGPTARFE